MHTSIKFFDYASKAPSACGEVLEIDLSSTSLNWSGVILEKGSSPHFFPSNVCTPYFYFALALDEDLHWQAKTDSGVSSLKTSPGDIWINPPGTPFSHHIAEPCYFVILAIDEQTLFENCPLPLDLKKLRFLNNYNVLDPTLKAPLNNSKTPQA